jgi:hypothetical protein
MFTVYPCFNFGLRVLVSCTCNICFKLWCFFDLCFSFFYPLAARVFTSFFRFAPLSPTISPFYWFVLILSSWMLCITLLTLICIGLSWLIWYVLLIFFICIISYQSILSWLLCLVINLLFVVSILADDLIDMLIIISVHCSIISSIVQVNLFSGEFVDMLIVISVCCINLLIC